MNSGPYNGPMRYFSAIACFMATSMLFGLEPGSIRVSEATGHLGKSIRILEDPTGVMDAASAARHPGYVSSKAAVPNLGITSSAWWITLTIVNDSPENHMFLNLEHAEVEEVDVYLVGPNGPVSFSRTGQSRPLETRSVAQPEFVFQLPISSGGTSTVLMRVASAKQLQIPLTVRTPSAFVAERSWKSLLIGGYAGIMIALALYNLFIYVSIRDRGYIVYVTYILLVGLTQFAFWGTGQYYIWGASPWLSTKASIILTFATAIAASEFMKQFIGTKENASRMHNGIKYFYAVFAMIVALYLFLAPSLAYQLAQVTAGVFAGYMFVTIWKVWRRGSRQAGYLLIAWSVFLIGTMGFTLKDMGVLPYNNITIFTMPLGSAIEGILLSFGLADRINILRREKEVSQAQALEASLENERIIREQNVILESRVKERTHALEESNQNLKETQTQLVNAEKMASLGQLTAGIAHEINNPINFITSNVAPLKRNIKDIVEVIKGYQEVDTANAVDQLERLRILSVEMDLEESISELDLIIASIAEGSSRTAEIVRGLRNFSRLDEDDLKEADLNEGLRNTLTMLAPQYRDKVDFSLELADHPKVECFPGKVNQVFMNIITNAAQATLARTDLVQREVTIRTSSTADTVCIIIADNGTGMSEAVKARIFDPFFTTKDVGEGTGLGMAIVYGIINDHGGNISIDTIPGAGTEFTITLPLRQVRQLQKSA